jgi:hypothetical protein
MDQKERKGGVDEFTKTYLTDEWFSLSMSNSDLRCDECGVTFTTAQDKEQHIKLEHEENKGPAGVK